MRAIEYHYQDPLATIWTQCAANIGFRVQRGGDAFATSDGKGTIHIASDDALDADDNLGQMVFHELCHALVQGPDAIDKPDWNLDAAHGDPHRGEYACLRVQATLAGRYGLRDFFAPTTDHRSFYDRLPADPLAGSVSDNSLRTAKRALQRTLTPPWSPHLFEALERTAGLATVIAPAVAGTTQNLWSLATPPGDTHPSGRPPHTAPASKSCGDCAWRFDDNQCRLGGDIDKRWPACEHWQAELDCNTCAACCRSAYDSVTVEADDPARERCADWLVDRGSYVELRRGGDQCAALDNHKDERFHCTIYDIRPVPCRDFERGGEHCLTARRRMGVSH